MLGEQAIRCAALQNEAEFARLWLVMAKQAEEYIHNPVLTQLIQPLLFVDTS